MVKTEDIKQILEKIKGIPGLSQELPDSADIIEQVKLDSLEMIQFMLELESNLLIEIDFEKLEFTHFSSIKNLSEALSQMQQ